MKFAFAALAIAATFAASAPGLAKNAVTKRPLPALYSDMSACRAVANATARVACYDEAMAKLDAAVASSDVVMVDKAQVEKTKRGLFGLQLPNFKLFGSDDQAPLAQIESTVASARGSVAGWTITLADGSIWQQMDDAPLALSPKAGMTVIVKSAALGSYKMAIAKQPAIRVKRIL